MLTGIDHLVIAVADPDAAARELEAALGIHVDTGGRHASLGTFNRLAWFGDTSLELIGVFDPALAAGSWIGAPTLKVLEGGGGLVTWSIASDALDADRNRLRATGSDLADPISGERVRPDGRVVRWRLAGPPSLGALAPFLIEHDPAAAEWTPADRADRSRLRHPAGGPIRLEALELRVPDVSQALQRLLRAAGLRFRPSLAGGGARDANIGSQVIRLRRGRGLEPLMATVHLAGPGLLDRSAELLGCHWVVRAG